MICVKVAVRFVYYTGWFTEQYCFGFVSVSESAPAKSSIHLLCFVVSECIC